MNRVRRSLSPCMSLKVDDIKTRTVCHFFCGVDANRAFSALRVGVLVVARSAAFGSCLRL